MTALIDKHLQAAPPTLTAPQAPQASPSPAHPRPADADKLLAERVERWKAIDAAGGIEDWITQQLRAKNLLVDDESSEEDSSSDASDDDSSDEDEEEEEEAFDDDSEDEDEEGGDEDSSDEDSGDEDSDDDEDEEEPPPVKKAVAKRAVPARAPTKAPAAKSDKDKRDYKERKKAEAAERRALHKLAWEAYTATHITHLGAGVFWSDSEDADAFDHDKREASAQTLKLDLASARQLAEALGVSIPTLRWLAFHREVDTGSHYRRWQIPKRDGSPRTISSPKKKLKTAQRWVLRNVLEKLPVHGAAHGFLSARSIVSNARVHAGAAVVVKVDIKDFFPSITWKRVKGLLRKSGLPEGVATVLSLLTTDSPRDVVQFRGKTLYVARGPRVLPQGAPTSPALTNAICLRLDRRVAGLARSLGFRYTRYADDLTFSWHPQPVLAGTSPRAGVGALLRGLKTIFEGEGFRINPKKTTIMRQGVRQAITGLIVNEAQGVPTARVPRETLRRLRAALHNREAGKTGKEGESLAQLKGMAAFVHMTDPAKGRELLARIEALEAKTKV